MTSRYCETLASIAPTSAASDSPPIVHIVVRNRAVAAACVV